MDQAIKIFEEWLKKISHIKINLNILLNEKYLFY